MPEPPRPLVPSDRKGPPLLVAVTGADGFVGRAVCARLAERGRRVRAITRRPAAVTGAGDNRVHGDLGEASARLFDGCDAVVNCAARVHITAPEERSEALAEYRRINRDLAVTLASAAQASGAACFVQISSVAAVATASPSADALSDGEPPRPTSPYGIAKLEADRALADLNRPGFRTVALRPPALYGPGAGAWFAKLLKAARRGVPLPLGAIANRRSFAYVANLADAVATALAGGASGPSGAYIVTDSPPIATADLYRHLLALSGHPDRVWRWPAGAVRLGARLLLGERAASLVGDAAFDGARFAREFGWAPPTAMAAALQATVRG